MQEYGLASTIRQLGNKGAININKTFVQGYGAASHIKQLSSKLTINIIEKRRKVMAITKDQLMDHLSQMPVIELAGLVKDLEEKWGVSAAAPQAAAAAPVAAAAEEKTEFNVVLGGCRWQQNCGD